VPRAIPFELLVEVAILVDKYSMLDVVAFFSDTWITNLKATTGLPQDYNSQVLPWLFIFFVFEKADGFSNMSRPAVQGCDETLGNDVKDNLPTPKIVIGKYLAFQSDLCMFTDCWDFRQDKSISNLNNQIYLGYCV
jgi:hypothetical protein